MSIAVMSEVWKHAPVKGTELLMLLALADSCNDDRECWPSVHHLCKKTRLSEPQVRKLLTKLSKQNLIAKVIQGGKGTKGRESNLYRVLDMTPITDDTSTPIMRDTSTPITDDTLNHHYESSLNHSSQPNGAKADSTSKPTPRAANPMYDAIKTVWGYTAGRNGLMAGLLTGTAKKGEWALYKLETPITPEQLLEWAKWYRRTELKGRTDLSMIAEPVKVQSSITRWLELRAAFANMSRPENDLSKPEYGDPWDNFTNQGDYTPDFLRGSNHE